MNLDELVDRIRSRINVAGLMACREKFAGTLWDKFFDLGKFVPTQAAHALRLSGHIPPRSRCLDLGAGFGYCALALQELGHTVHAVENVYEPVMATARCVPVANWHFISIDRQGIWEPPAGQWNLIVMHGVAPFRDKVGWWGGRDYISLGLRLAERLAEKGVMEWIVNRGDEGLCALDQSLWDATLPPRLLPCVHDNIVTVRRISEEPTCVAC